MQREGEEVAGVAAEEQGAEHDDGLGGDGEQEPGAVDAVGEAGLRALEHDGEEGGVGEERPERRGSATRGTHASVHQPWIDAEALPRTLVAATVVRKAKPLAWLVMSAASSSGTWTSRQSSSTARTT